MIYSDTSTARATRQLWDPMSVLGLINPDRNGITCMGEAKTYERRCRISVSTKNSGKITKIITSLSRKSPCFREIENELRDLLSHSLCHHHKGQEDEIVREWGYLIDDLGTTTRSTPVKSPHSEIRSITRSISLDSDSDAFEGEDDDTLVSLQAEELDMVKNSLQESAREVLGLKLEVRELHAVKDQLRQKDEELIVLREQTRVLDTVRDQLHQTDAELIIFRERSRELDTVKDQLRQKDAELLNLREQARELDIVKDQLREKEEELTGLQEQVRELDTVKGQLRERDEELRTARENSVDLQSTMESIHALIQSRLRSRAVQEDSGPDDDGDNDEEDSEDENSDTVEESEEGEEERWLDEDGYDLPQPECPLTHVTRRTIREECSVCLRDMGDEPLQTLIWCKGVCGHSVHRDCFAPWEEGNGGISGCVNCRAVWQDPCDHDSLARPSMS